MTKQPSFFTIARFKASLQLVIAIGLMSLGFSPTVRAAGGDIFGSINPPAGVDKYNSQAGAGGIGIMIFISNIIRLSTILAGIWVFINFILAGWIYITSAGDKGASTKVSEKMTMSVMGLMIIVGAYTVAAILGLVIFGDASYIINPKLKGIQ